MFTFRVVSRACLCLYHGPCCHILSTQAVHWGQGELVGPVHCLVSSCIIYGGQTVGWQLWHWRESPSSCSLARLPSSRARMRSSFVSNVCNWLSLANTSPCISLSWRPTVNWSDIIDEALLTFSEQPGHTTDNMQCSALAHNCATYRGPDGGCKIPGSRQRQLYSCLW